MVPIKRYPAILIIILASLACIFSQFAAARDISTLQTALTLARENMEKALTQQEASANAVIQQQQLVTERRKQLADESNQLVKMQKDSKQAQALYLEAQKNFDKAQAALDEAWGK